MSQNIQEVSPSIDIKTSSTVNSGVPRSLMYFVISICFFCILADGYDLGIYGAVLPSLLEYQPWGLTPAQAGTIGSYALFGMFFGAILVGTITDLIGRNEC